MTESNEQPRKRKLLRMHSADAADDVADELQFHVEMRAAELVQRGLSEHQAREAALNRFGDYESVRDECELLERSKTRTKSRAMILSELMQDISWALRGLKRAPTFACVVILTLGLGIGANAAVLSVVNTYLFRPMPVRDARQLAVVAQTSKGNDHPGSVSYMNYLDIKGLSSVFSDAILFQGSSASARADGWTETERVFLDMVSDNYFSSLGVKPAVGSVISTDAARRREPLIVLDNRYWKRRFNSDPAIVGKSIRLNGTPYTVAGVVDEQFTDTEQLIVIDAYIPISTIARFSPPDSQLLTQRGWSSNRVMAYLKPGVSAAQARSALATLARETEKRYPDEVPGLGYAVEREMRARPDIAVANVIPWIAGVFLGLTVLVLVVACVNVTNLMLARGNARQNEMAVRQALGAGDTRLIRQLLTESVVLAVSGLLLGLILARAVTGWISSFHVAVDFPVRFNVVLDWRVFATTATIAIVAGMLTGVAPALRSKRVPLSETLREGSRGGTGSLSRQRLQSILVVGQVAVSLVLLISAGLFTQSVRAAAATDLGFKKENQLLMSTDLAPLHLDAPQRRVLLAQMQERAMQLPGVTSAAIARDVPLGGNNNMLDAYFDENIPGTSSNNIDIIYNTVTPKYFETIGMRVLKGREFSADDRDSSTRVVIINAEMARRFWPTRDAVGQQFRTRKDGPKVLVVGVVANSRYTFLNELPKPYIYLPMAQRPVEQITLHFRTTANPTVIASSARTMLQQLNPDLALFGVKSMQTHLNDGIALLFIRFGALVATVLGGLGLLQSIVGLYGVISYGVSQRTREIGIRLALGATGGNVMRGIMQGGAVLTGVGLGIGLLVAGLSTRLMQNLLVGVDPMDWKTFTGAALVLATVATLSAYLPARRASRLDPLLAIRSE